MIQELLDHGFQCRNLDVKPPRAPLCDFVPLDMCDYGAVFDAMAGCDAVVHFAGDPRPDEEHFAAADRFANNTVALFNAFNAAAAHGIKRVVWASSETIFGHPFVTNQPPEVPMDETAAPAPQTGYAISKAVSETIAEQMAALHDMTFIGLRLSNVLYDDPSADAAFQKIPGYWSDLSCRKFNLWGYVHIRDVTRAVRLALEANLTGAEVFSIAASDTIMRQPSRALVAAVMPDATVLPALTGRTAMLDCAKARAMLGWEPEYSWQDVLGIDANASSKKELL
ncbi:UDP-glucose 4-epimerase [Candidatus Rhodobacter oscarellae]|uniref:UDP-glucose 4-epimerase n=1 Tax=Candidatus Rhodobacter oscarellae TaxID=1675527 RepID=A0A0J9E3R8_9RHOB|nr:UDP-glucose 4-epimerase [Candidatus Rhodobacter lobularis]